MSGSERSASPHKRHYRKTSQRLKPPVFSLTASVAKYIKQAEIELGNEYATYCGQISIQSPEAQRESLNLRRELNHISAQCKHKADLLARLQMQSKFPVESQPLSPDFELIFDTPSSRISELKRAIYDAGDRIEREELRNEALQSMLETVTQAATIMRERSNATQIVLNRVTSQLYQVKRLHTVALNSLTLASASASRSRLALVASKEQLLDRISRKKSDIVVLENASRRAVERIGTAVCNQAETARRKQIFRETLEEAGAKHLGEKQRRAQTAMDLEQYNCGFQTIAQVLARRSCMLSYHSGLSPESIQMLVAQLNHLAMREASLASHHSQLALERCEKESELRALRSELLTLINTKSNAIILREEMHIPRQSPKQEMQAEELCIRLHAGVMSVLGQLDFAHRQTSGSTDDQSWVLVHSLVQGSATQPPASPGSVQRSSTRSKTTIHSGKSIAESVQNRASFHTYPSLTEIRELAGEIGVQLQESEFVAIDWLLKKALVVKHSVDWEMIQEFLLEVQKQGFDLRILLEKCHSVLKSGFKEVVDAAVEAVGTVKKIEFRNPKLTYLSRTSSCRSFPSEVQLSPDSPSKQDQRHSRLRISMLPCKIEDDFSDDSHSQPLSRSKRTSQENTSKPPSPLCDQTAETQYILATRSQFKSSRFSATTLTKRSEPLSSVRFRYLHQRETPPTTERAQILLKDFLATERRIAAVKDAERVSAKAESAKHTPKALCSRTNTAAGYRRYHRSTQSLGSFKTTLQF